jgi:hypothetical protein
MSRLPEGFEALEPFVDRWARPSSAARVEARLDSDDAARAAFYTAGRERLAEALALLDRKPLGEHDEKERRLMDLLLSLAHVSLAVELQRDHEPSQAAGRRHIRVIGTTADHRR